MFKYFPILCFVAFKRAVAHPVCSASDWTNLSAADFSGVFGSALYNYSDANAAFSGFLSRISVSNSGASDLPCVQCAEGAINAFYRAGNAR